MRLPRHLWGLAVACLMALSSVGAIQAQQLPAEPIETLQRRLAEQESRIERLEFERLPAIDTVSTHNMALEHRIAELEQRLNTIGGASGWGKPEESDGKPTQKWFGRIHADHWAFPGNDDGANFFENGNINNDIQDRFLFRRLRFGVSGDIGYTMLYKVEMEWADPADTAFKDAYFGWKELPILRTVLLGNQKRPYGLDHLNSSRYNTFIERPFVIEAFNQDARRFGIQSYGLSDDQAYNWRFGAFLSRDMAKIGDYLVTDDPGVHHYQAEFAGRFANTIWYDETSGGRGYAHWAVAGSIGGADGTPGNTRNVARFLTRPEARTSGRWLDTGAIDNAEYYTLGAVEGVVNIGAFQVVGEAQYMTVDRSNAGALDFYGGYVYVSYFLTGEHVPWARKSGTLGRVKPFENFFLVRDCDGVRGKGWGAWQVAARYSFADFTDDNVLGGVGKSVTFGMNWWWTPYSRMQFNYIHGDIDQRGIGPGAANYNIIGSRFMVDF